MPRCALGALSAASAALITLSACAEGDLPADPPAIVDPSVRGASAPGEPPPGFGSYLAGRFAYASNDISSAASFMEQALAGDPADHALLQRAVTLMVADGRIKDALALAPRLTQAEPGARIAHLLLALDDFAGRRYDAAEKRLDQVSPDGVYVLLLPAVRAWLTLARGSAPKAFEALEPISRREAYAGFYHYQAALIADYGGDAKLADEHYRKTITVVPGGSLRAAEAYGAFLERQNRRAEAEAVYDGYLEKNPDTVWLDLVLERFGRCEAPKPAVASPLEGVAEALFDAASAVPQDSGNDAGLLYARLALELRPEFDVARMLVGETLDALNRPEKALAIYQSIGPGSPFAWTARLRAAAAHAQLERYDDAITQLKLAVADRKSTRLNSSHT